MSLTARRAALAGLSVAVLVVLCSLCLVPGRAAEFEPALVASDLGSVPLSLAITLAPNSFTFLNELIKSQTTPLIKRLALEKFSG